MPEQSFQAVDQIEVLVRTAAADAGAAPTPGDVEVNEALEWGFAQLMGLEARLRRAQRADPEVRVSSVVAEISKQIESLSGALRDLRAVSTRDGEMRTGYGFVLPGEPDRGASQTSDIAAGSRFAG
ncbi:MAG: hypothetical protein ACR2NR_21685 [Solirubrobacteraceae bacterium]